MRLATERASLREMIEKACSMGLQQVEHDPMFLIQMALWTQHALDAQSKESLKELYNEFDEHFLPLYHHLLDQFGFEPRPPFTYEVLAHVVTALAEGLTLRRRLDPDAVPIDAFGWMVQGMMFALIRRKGDDRDLWEAWDAFRETFEPGGAPPATSTGSGSVNEER